MLIAFYVSSFIAMILSFIGNIFLNKKDIRGFYIFCVANTIFITTALVQDPMNYFQIIMLLGFFILNIKGISLWKKVDKVELETIKLKHSDDFKNALTELMDEHLIETVKESLAKNNLSFRTYIYSHQISKGSWPIRFPGMTVGSIIINENNEITNIIIGDDAVSGKVQKYNPTVKQAVKKFIGYRIAFK